MPKEPWLVDEVADEDAEMPGGLRACLFISITIFVILALLGTAIASILWLLLSAPEVSPATESVLQQGPPHAEAVELSTRASITATLPETIPPPTVRVTATSPAGSGDMPTPKSALPAPALPVNRIVLINGNHQVETIAPDGSDRRPLTDARLDTSFQFPAWSPDGRSLAVIGQGFRGAGVYVLDDHGTPAALAEQEVYFSTLGLPFYLYWSPDSRYLSFLSNHSDNRISLNLVPRDGTAESQMLTYGNPVYWTWTADSRQLLVHNGRGRLGPRLSLLSLSGDTQQENLGSPGYFQTPGISSDGRYLAFAEQANFGLSTLLVIMDRTGNEQRRENQRGSLALSWSPVANQLAFISGEERGVFSGALRLLDMTTGELRLLTTETVIAFFWSPDGRSIAYFSADSGDAGEIEVYAPRHNLPVTTNRFIRASPDRARNGIPMSIPVQQQFHRFQLSVMDVESGTGLRLLTFQPSLPFLTQFLPFFDQYSLSHRLWSPDSRSLVLATTDNGIQRIFVIPISGGDPRPLSEGEIAFWSHQ